MKSSPSQLAQRGFIPENYKLPKTSLSPEAAIKLLQSTIPTERSIAARILTHRNEHFVKPLIKALRQEKKLYTKIEICNALIAQNPASIKPLIAELGKIGNNQHRSIPEKGFHKDSYPLPRDIAARTLCRIGLSVLPDLQKTLDSGNSDQISEAIDAIGHICFQSHQPWLYDSLRSCLDRNPNNDLIKWKLMRAMSAFPESLALLSQQLAECSNPWVAEEIKRSLRFIGYEKVIKSEKEVGCSFTINR